MKKNCMKHMKFVTSILFGMMACFIVFGTKAKADDGISYDYQADTTGLFTAGERFCAENTRIPAGKIFYKNSSVASFGTSTFEEVSGHPDYFTSIMPVSVHYVVDSTPADGTFDVHAIFFYGHPESDSDDHDDNGKDHEEHHSSKHTDSSKDYTYKEIDGQLVYGGDLNGDFVTTTVIPASAYPLFTSFLVDKLNFKQQEEEDKDDTIVIKCGVWNSLPKKVMVSFSNKPRDIELIYKAADGLLYRILIPSGTDVAQYVDENGYCGLSYLGSQLGQTLYTE